MKELFRFFSSIPHFTFLNLSPLFVLINFAIAQIPQTISYQGVLADTGGVIVQNGDYSMTFKLYEVETGGTDVWSETQVVPVSKGIFNVILGSANPLNLPFDKPYWLGLSVDGGAELTPRIELTSAAYSLNAIGAGGGNTLDQAYDQGGPGAGRTITADAGAVNIEGPGGLTVNGKLGIGTTTPEHPLHVKGFFKLEGADFRMAEPSVGDGGRVLVHRGDGSGTNDQMILNFAGDFEEGMRVEGSKFLVDGNLGIGTTKPQSKLHVKGWMQLEGSDFWMADSNRGDGGRVLVHIGSGSGTDDQMILNFAGDFEEGVNIGGSKLIVNGKLGIGTSAPTQQLEVADTIYSSHGGFKFPDGSVQETAASGGGGGDNLGNHTATQNINLNGHWLSGDGGDEGVYVNNNGHVGIGTTIPDANLKVEGQENQLALIEIDQTGMPEYMGLRLERNNNEKWLIGMDNLNDNLIFRRSAGSNDMIIDENGNVGIGIMNPEHRLHVKGFFELEGADFRMAEPTRGDGGRVLVHMGSGSGTDDQMVLNFAGDFEEGVKIGGSKLVVDGNVGIGTTNPSANLHVEGIDGALFEGTLNSGAIPREGEGTRMMWYPAKGAFRAGSVEGINWNADSIGDFSVAMGYNTRASGPSSTALGFETRASGFRSTAFGDQCIASGWISTAMGYGTMASGSRSTAMGLDTRAGGWASTAMGVYSKASGAASTAMGFSSGSKGDYSMAAGKFAKANHEGCFVWSDASANFSSDSIFSTAENQFLIHASGGVGIGTNNPVGNLHVNGNYRYAGYFTSDSASNLTDVIHSEFTGSGYFHPRAVYGKSIPAPGYGFGGYFEGGWVGVRAYATETGIGSRYGVISSAWGGDGGIYGVSGSASYGSTTYGVYGYGFGGSANDYAVYASGNLAYTGSLISLSDGKLKENVRPLNNALTKIQQLKPKTFQFTDNPQYAHMNLSAGDHYGLIAQEVEQVLPELVSDNSHPSAAESRGEKSDDPPIHYKGLNYIELIPILIEAIKEQQTIIDEQQQDIEELQSQMRQIQNR